MHKVLTLNTGSSSIKYRLFDMSSARELASGVFARIGMADAYHELTCSEGSEFRRYAFDSGATNYRDGLSSIDTAISETGLLDSFTELHAIGHRVVHGGEKFSRPVLIDQKVLDEIREIIPLAPLHNPVNIAGIEMTLQKAPDVPQVAVFDTAFHQSMPPAAFRYALPNSLYADLGVRRYGFHGTSHSHVAKQAAKYLDKPLESLNLITLHLGNGASAAAIRAGRCIDTSMGMTPLEGLVMGSRSGDIDPSITFYLHRQGYGLDETEAVYNTQSGLRGLCGTNDMREVHERANSGDADAALARDMYCYRIRKYIGAYMAILGGADAIVFTGGVGENDSWVREQCCSGMQQFGIVYDPAKQRSSAGVVDFSHAESRAALLVVPANEEFEIAKQTMACLGEPDDV